MFLAVHHDFQGFLKPHVPHILRLLNGRHLVKDFLLEDAVARVSVDGKVAHTEAGEILEEVRTL